MWLLLCEIAIYWSWAKSELKLDYLYTMQYNIPRWLSLLCAHGYFDITILFFTIFICLLFLKPLIFFL